MPDFDVFEPFNREHRLRRVSSILGVLAWLLFALGLVGMLGVALVALLSESDGDFRTWETIRRHVQMLWCAGALAVGGPTSVWLFERWLDYHNRPMDPEEDDSGSDPLEWRE
jgi:hypothetical protein